MSGKVLGKDFGSITSCHCKSCEHSTAVNDSFAVMQQIMPPQHYSTISLQHRASLAADSPFVQEAIHA